MELSKKIQPIVLAYDEAGWTEKTTACLIAAGLDNIHYADRDGVGSMAKAFNRSAAQVMIREQPPEYIWFVTNVTFPPEMPAALLQAIEADERAIAIHPAFDSDHPHIRQYGQEVRPAPFIEWTAPLVWARGWEEVGPLDEAMPYVHFDLDWSRRAAIAGWSLLVDSRYRLGHTYLWKEAPEPISQLRRSLRSLRHAGSLARMEEKWGQDWRTKLCPTGTCG